MDKDFQVDSLKSMKRDRLQKLCKKLKLKANGKNTELVTSLQQYFENHYATTACACAGEKHNTLQMCNDWPNVVVETEDNGSLQSQSRGKRRSTIKDNANTNTTHDEQMSLESQSIEASQPLVTKDCPKSTTKQTKTSQSQPIHSPFHHSRATKPSLIKKRKENRVINANTNQSKENAQKRPQVLDVTSNHPPAKSPRCSKDFGSRRKTYSISPDTKKKSHDKLKTTIMEELEQRLQQKYGSKPAAADDCLQSRIPRLAVFCIGKSPYEKQTKFDEIHRTTFGRMESISDYMGRKAQRMKKLLTPVPTRPATCHTKRSSGKTTSTVKNLSTFSFSMQDKKSTSNRPTTASSSPFKFSVPTKQTPKKPQFDLQASLSRQLPYKPHTGKLKDVCQEDKSVTPVKRLGLKTRQAPPVRSKCRSEAQKLQKAKRNENAFKRRQLND